MDQEFRPEPIVAVQRACLWMTKTMVYWLVDMPLLRRLIGFVQMMLFLAFLESFRWRSSHILSPRCLLVMELMVLIVNYIGLKTLSQVPVKLVL